MLVQACFETLGVERTMNAKLVRTASADSQLELNRPQNAWIGIAA